MSAWIPCRVPRKPPTRTSAGGRRRAYRREAPYDRHENPKPGSVSEKCVKRGIWTDTISDRVRSRCITLCHESRIGRFYLRSAPCRSQRCGSAHVLRWQSVG